MKFKSISLFTIAPVLSFAILTACANPCAGKNKTTATSTEETKENTTTTKENTIVASNNNVGGPLAEELQGKPVVVDIYATWCSGCKNIAPTLAELKEEYEGKAHFVVLDVTNKSTSDEAQMKAKEMGLEKFFSENKSKTATVAIIDPATGNILSQERKNANLTDYASVLDSAIAKN